MFLSLEYQENKLWKMYTVRGSERSLRNIHKITENLSVQSKV